MLDKSEIKKIQEATEEFFQKMTINVLDIEADFSTLKNETESFDDNKKITEIIDIRIRLDEPQILIGEKGQTLFEIQRLLRTILNKKIQKFFYLNLDINNYKKKKIEYLKDLARDLADQVSLTKEEKVLFPMPAYERRIIHMELSQRTDVATESRGQNQERYVVIKPR
jgi:spoIIIJ-associated protein